MSGLVHIFPRMGGEGKKEKKKRERKRRKKRSTREYGVISRRDGAFFVVVVSFLLSFYEDARVECAHAAGNGTLILTIIFRRHLQWVSL